MAHLCAPRLFNAVNFMFPYRDRPCLLERARRPSKNKPNAAWRQILQVGTFYSDADINFPAQELKSTKPLVYSWIFLVPLWLTFTRCRMGSQTDASSPPQGGA